ncbi:MAG TPA: alanine/glycine:cation symporter family protein, partial [Vicinamibacterales bacterium]|nr:alanine/glycine:cation symporter family protein [Vicinamibacterales bacterium]
NIAGVATALMWGGPGAIFWMWVCGFLGMATKYSEAMLGVQYRQKHPDGSIAGGPMYYIRYGLKDTGFARALAAFFAVCGGFAALFGTGNMMQSNQMSLAMQSEFGVPMWITGAVVTVLTALVILGGLKRIASVTEKLVPAMILLYLAFGAIVLVMNAANIPGAFWLIIDNAFTPTAATGGFLGATVMQGLQFGARRGILSNEAGLGSAPIAHAAAQTPSAITQGLVGVAEVFIDTIVVCTFTGLILLSSGMWTSGLAGSAMTAGAFSNSVPVVGGLVVAFSSALFGYSTLIGWSYYGEQCLKYLFGVRITLPYRLVFITLTFIGAVVSIEVVFFVGDIANAFMALPNLIGLMLLSGVVARMTREGVARDPVFRHNQVKTAVR